MLKLPQSLLRPGPPMLLRWRKRMLVATIVCFAASALYVLLDDPLNLPHRQAWKAVATCVAIFPVAVLYPLWLWRTRQLRHLATERQGRLCPRCAYDYAGLPDTGTCPECGNDYSAANDAPLWIAFAEDSSFLGRTPPPPSN